MYHITETPVCGPYRNQQAHLGSVVPEPVVRFPEIVEDDSAAVAAPRAQNNGRARIRFWRHPDRVGGEQRKEKCHCDHNAGCDL